MKPAGGSNLGNLRQGFPLPGRLASGGGGGSLYPPSPSSCGRLAGFTIIYMFKHGSGLKSRYQFTIRSRGRIPPPPLVAGGLPHNPGPACLALPKPALPLARSSTPALHWTATPLNQLTGTLEPTPPPGEPRPTPPHGAFGFAGAGWVSSAESIFHENGNILWEEADRKAEI
jgi:hypothetical protein